MEVHSFARKLRQHQTKAEKKMWALLRRKHMKGYKFRRQHPLFDCYLADFCCPKLKLIIEIDGENHNLPEQIRKDKEREKNLINMGYSFLRFTNK